MSVPACFTRRGWCVYVIHLSLGFPLLAAVEPLVAQAPALAPVGVIGCDFCNGPEQFSGIQALALDDQGRIYVADRSEPRIWIFAPDGESIRAFGREGRGPGEMQYVLGIRPAESPRPLCDPGRTVERGVFGEYDIEQVRTWWLIEGGS